MKLASGRLVARGGFGEKIRQSLDAPAPACLSPPQARALGPAGVGLSAAGAALALLRVILRDGKTPRSLTLDTSPRGELGLPGCRPGFLCCVVNMPSSWLTHPACPCADGSPWSASDAHAQ